MSLNKALLQHNYGEITWKGNKDIMKEYEKEKIEVEGQHNCGWPVLVSLWCRKIIIMNIYLLSRLTWLMPMWLNYTFSFHERSTAGSWYSSGFNAKAKSGKVGAVSMILNNITNTQVISLSTLLLLTKRIDC